MLTQSTNLVISLNFARSEAIKRKTRVSVRALTPTALNEWGLGWQVTDDSTIPFTVIRQNDATCANTSLDDFANRNSYTYLPTSGIAVAGNISICDDRTGEQGRLVNINFTGRPHVRRIPCS